MSNEERPQNASKQKPQMNVDEARAEILATLQKPGIKGAPGVAPKADLAKSHTATPIPEASDAEQEAIADLPRTCSAVAEERYKGRSSVQRRLHQAFGNIGGQLNQKAAAWWEIPMNRLGDALKESFKLATNPLKSPRTADEWDPYLKETLGDDSRLTRALGEAEAELNDRVYRLFDLTPDEITLLQKEVEH